MIWLIKSLTVNYKRSTRRSLRKPNSLLSFKFLVYTWSKTHPKRKKAPYSSLKIIHPREKVKMENRYLSPSLIGKID
jgi:hypothetical protein